MNVRISAVRRMALVGALGLWGSQVHAAESCASQLSGLDVQSPAARLIRLANVAVDCQKLGRFVYEKANALQAVGRMDEAIRLLEDALNDRSVDGRFENLILYAHLLLKIKEADNAQAIATQLSMKFPSDYRVEKLQAEISFAKYDYKNAGIYADRSLKKQPDNLLYLMLIFSRYALDDYSAAIDAYREAQAKKVPENVLFRDPATGVAIAHSLYQMGRMEEAACRLQDQLKRTPALVGDAHVDMLAQSLRKKGYGLKQCALPVGGP